MSRRAWTRIGVPAAVAVLLALAVAAFAWSDAALAGQSPWESMRALMGRSLNPAERAEMAGFMQVHHPEWTGEEIRQMIAACHGPAEGTD